MMWEVGQIIIQALQEYFGGWPVFILYVAALLYIVCTTGKDGRTKFLIPVIAAALTVFNPVIVKVAMDMADFDYSTRYLRFYWILTYYIVIAYALVLLIKRQKKVVCQILLLIAFVIVVLLIGRPVFHEETMTAYTLPENSYFTDDVLVRISYLMHEDGTERPRCIYDTYLIQKLRTYDPSVISEFDRRVAMHYERGWKMPAYVADSPERMLLYHVYFEEGYEVPGSDVIDALHSLDIDYVIVPAETEKEEYFRNIGLQDVGTARNYVVYRVE